MKKPYSTLFLTLAFCASLFSVGAQSSIGASDIQTAGKKQTKPVPGSHKAVIATLTCLNPYVTDTTMDLSFRLSLTNIDEEYGDSLSITFPAGITPISSPSNPLYTPADVNAEPEALNGISGLTITWGDNDNSYGGIQPGSDAFFTIRVAISAGVSGDKTGAFFVSGDTYANPADFAGSFALSQTEAPANLAVFGFAPYPHYATPLSQAIAAPLTAIILNDGGTFNEAVNLQFYVFPGGFNDTKAIPTPLSSTNFAIVESDPFTPVSSGFYQALFNGVYPADADNLNNMDSVEFEITDSYFSANSGDTAGVLGLGLTSPGTFASLIPLPVGDTLTTVSALFSVPSLGARVRAVVYPFDTATGMAGALIVASPIYTFGASNAQYRDFTFNQILAAGNYLIGLEQVDSANYGLGTTFENYQSGYSYVKFGAGAFQNLELYPAQFRRTFFMRTFFGDRTGVGIADNNISNTVLISPNPSTGTITIHGIETATISVMDNLGRVVQQSNINPGNTTISINTLQSGNYIVRLETATGVAYKQITLVK